MMDKYIIENDVPVKCNDIIKWAKWYERADRRVNVTEINGIEVSTVFLGVDLSWGGGTPLLYETMVFGGSFDGIMKRYGTYKAALAGHEKIVNLVKGGYSKDKLIKRKSVVGRKIILADLKGE